MQVCCLIKISIGVYIYIFFFLNLFGFYVFWFKMKEDSRLNKSCLCVLVGLWLGDIPDSLV